MKKGSRPLAIWDSKALFYMFKESPSALAIISKHHGDAPGDAAAPGDGNTGDAAAPGDGNAGDAAAPVVQMYDAVSDAE